MVCYGRLILKRCIHILYSRIYLWYFESILKCFFSSQIHQCMTQ